MKDSQLCIDPLTKHIIGATLFNGTEDLSGPSLGVVRVTTISPISSLECENVYLDEIATAALPDDITEGDRKYCYINDAVVECPKMTITITGHDHRNLPLGQDIEVVIVYEEDALVSFADQVDTIKFKDRFDFITVESRLDFDQATRTAKTTIRSDFPGACKLRAKDTKFLCFFEPLEIRFKQ